MKRIFLLLIITTVSLGSFALLSQKTEALSGSEFQPGRIIDDFTFFNSNTMSPDDIQRFLNAKVPVCDTNGTQPYGGTTAAQYGISKGYPPPYTCLKNYSQSIPAKTAEAGLCNGINPGVRSAAQIIYDVSKSCGVNPQSLIVLLQKEQTLVTDDWPWSIQYRSATGYGCPDTAPCDSEYYGFFNQVYNAARQFKRYAKSETLFRYRAFRTNYIQYNPNTSCGGSNVYIQNRATAGLYNYTPYQPNPSALANLYGTGDGCGAYGNRNFWRLFREWFGSVYANDTDIAHPNGTLVSDGSKIYLIEANKRRHVANSVVFASYNYTWGQVKRMTFGDRKLPIGTALTDFAPGTLFRTDNSPVYVMEYEGTVLKKRHVSYNTFTSLNYNWNDVKYVAPSQVPAQTHSSVWNNLQHPSGSIVLNQSNNRVYYVEMGKLRYLTPAVFASHNFPWGKLKNATAQDKALAVNSNFEPRQGAIFNSNGSLYIIDRDASGSLKRPVGPWECYADRWHFSSADWDVAPLSTLPSRTGSTFTC